MNELFRVAVGSVWLPDEKPHFHLDEVPRVIEFAFDYLEDGVLIRHFVGSVELKQGLKSATIGVNIEMLPNPIERWRHDPVEENVDLELELLSGHAIVRWAMRHGIGQLTGDEAPRTVWQATHVGQLFTSEITHMDIYLWRDRFVRC